MPPRGGTFAFLIFLDLGFHLIIIFNFLARYRIFINGFQSIGLSEMQKAFTHGRIINKGTDELLIILNFVFPAENETLGPVCLGCEASSSSVSLSMLKVPTVVLISGVLV